MIGAIIGGGVKLVQVELSPVTSLWRQLLLGLFGVGLVIWGLNSGGLPTADQRLTQPGGPGASGAPSSSPVANEATTAGETPSTPPETTGNPGRGEPDYLIPDSQNRLLVAGDLAGLSVAQLRLARNEIYARHGRRFKSADLASYFARKAWYSPISDEVSLSPVEEANVQFIRRFETSGG